MELRTPPTAMYGVLWVNVECRRKEVGSGV